MMLKGLHCSLKTQARLSNAETRSICAPNRIPIRGVGAVSRGALGLGRAACLGMAVVALSLGVTAAAAEPSGPIARTPEKIHATYVLWGDSLTGGVRGIIPNNGHSAVTQAFLDKGLTSPGNERRVVNCGIGGQTAVQIAARQGGLATTCQVMGGQLPASGSVTLASVYPDVLFNPTRDGRLDNFPVFINGVAGTITRTDPTTYTFTRTTAGAVVADAGNVVIVPDTTDVAPLVSVDNFAPAAKPGADLNEYTAILWLGHNGIGGAKGETILSLVHGCVGNLRNPSKKFLILPSFNANTEKGTGGYTNLQNNVWKPLADAYPDNYYDIRRDFIDTSKAWMQANYPAEYAADWGQAFIGSRSNAGADSDYDIRQDMIPRALRGDMVHLNAMGNDLLAELLAAKLLSLGW
jgi:lysophospholipase L1-like esterase